MERGKRDISSKSIKQQTDVMLSESVSSTEEIPEYFKKVIPMIICAYHQCLSGDSPLTFI